ncbi:hypothetical protein ACEQ77_005196 [Vibrio harveyi]
MKWVYLMEFDYKSQIVVQNVVDAMNDDEAKLLAKNLNMAESISRVELASEFFSSGGHSISNFFRKKGNSYFDILVDVGKTLGLDISYSYKMSKLDNLNSEYNDCLTQIRDLEYLILEGFFKKVYDNMTFQQQDEFDKELIKLAEKSKLIVETESYKGLAGATLMLSLLKTGGFSTYIYLSSIISGITLGTAGFSTYVAASSTLSVLLGPAGWACLLGAGIYKLGKPNEQKMLSSVLTVIASHKRQESEEPLLECHNENDLLKLIFIISIAILILLLII